MNKYQREKERIKRDKIEKQKRRNEKNKNFGNVKSVITHQNYFDALTKCRKGVNWKNSVQCYTINAPTEIDKTIKSLNCGKLPKLSNCKKIVIYERGKERIIIPITIRDRMTQRVICDNSLIPMIGNTLIYDNGASTKGKGVDFARKRVEKYFRNAINEYGADNVYALTYDFKSFFDSISHQTCLDILRELYGDEEMSGLIMSIVRSYQEAEIKLIADPTERQRQLNELYSNKRQGICLGSQISQILALIVPNKLDHFVKDKMGVKYYIRYMDDGLILSNDKKYLAELLKKMKIVVRELGLEFNTKKTRIVKMTKGVIFMKIKYNITKSGKLIKRLTRQGTVRMRRKLKKFRKLVNEGKMTLDDVYNSMQSWLAHANLVNAYKTKKSMLKLYNELFDGYRITKRFWHLVRNKVKGRNVPYEFLQIDKWERLRWCGNAGQFLEIPK